jgi:hypothetical protein
MLVVGVGADSFRLGLLLDVEELVDGDDVAAGAAASFVEAAGEQVAAVAAAVSREPVAAAGTFVDAAGGSGEVRGQRERDWPDGAVTCPVRGLPTTRRAP